PGSQRGQPRSCSSCSRPQRRLSSAFSISSFPAPPLLRSPLAVHRCPSRPPSENGQRTTANDSCPRLLVQQCLDPCVLATDLSHLRRALDAPRGALKAQLEQLLGQLTLARLQLVGSFLAQFGGVVRLHSAPSSIARLMKRVLIGSLCAARRNASSAISRVTPSIS